MSSYDETARLILMDDPSIKVRDFATILKAAHPDLLNLPVDVRTAFVAKLHIKYVGCDKIRPTHSIETGERL